MARVPGAVLMSIEELDYLFHSMQEQQEGPVYLCDLHREQEETAGEVCRL